MENIPDKRARKNRRDSRRSLNEEKQLVLLAWLGIVERLTDPDFELTIEEFAAVLVAFKRLQLAGVDVDPGLAAIMTVLERGVIDSSEDGDSDLSDQWLDHDDPDEDYSDPKCDTSIPQAVRRKGRPDAA